MGQGIAMNAELLYDSLEQTEFELGNAVPLLWLNALLVG